MIVDTVTSYIPMNRRTAPNGWVTFNCPACVFRGHRPDTKFRGGLILSDGGFTYHCFNCSFKAGWKPGSQLGKNVLSFMEYINVPDTEIEKCRFFALAQDSTEQAVLSPRAKRIYPLPDGAKLIKDLINENCDDPHFFRVLEYIGSRNIEVIDWYDLYYVNSPDKNLRKRFIIPTLVDNKVVGWAARAIDDKIDPRYLIQSDKSFMFNTDILRDRSRKFTVVVEGQLDAMAIDGVGLMSNELLQSQEVMFDNDQTKILLPDKDKAGRELVQRAIELGWWVSYPEWPEKDAFEAAAKYGRIPSIVHILDRVQKTPLTIELHARSYFT